MKDKHPEQKADELFLGNATVGDVMRSSWRTSRLGRQPFMLDGKPIAHGELRPWFIEAAEVRRTLENLRNRRADETPNHAERIRTFTAMLSEQGLLEPAVT